MPDPYTGVSGVSEYSSRADHAHKLSNSIPLVEGVAVAGSSKLPSRGDHVHSVRNISGNYLFNGTHKVRQRGNGPFVAAGYTIDCMYLSVGGSTVSQTAQAHSLGVLPGVKEAGEYVETIVTSVAGAANLVNIRYFVEDVALLAGKTCTVSFYAKADAARTIAVELTQNFGTGGTPSAEITGLGIYKPTLTTSWTKYFNTFTFPSINTKTLGSNFNSRNDLNFWFDAGSNYNSRTETLGQQSGTFSVDLVKLEIGSSATLVEQENEGIILNRCRRYYQVVSGDTGTGVTASATTANRVSIAVVPMRAGPTAVMTACTIYDGLVNNPVTAINGVYGQGPNIQFDLVISGGGLTAGRPACLNGGTIALSAEL